MLRTNLAVRDLNVIAYAGIPISAQSEAIGSFCAIDSKPRQWTDEQLAALRDLSLIAQSYITAGIESADSRSKMDALTNGIAGAARLLLRPAPGISALGTHQASPPVTLLCDELLDVVRRNGSHCTRASRGKGDEERSSRPSSQRCLDGLSLVCL